VTGYGTVVISGGTGVLGQAIARRLSEEGASVVLVGRRAPDDPVVRDALDQLGPTTDYRRHEIGSDAELAEIIAKYGDLRAAVYAAGAPLRATVLEASSEQIESALRVNTVGAIELARVAGRALVANGNGGSILTIGSWVEIVPDREHVFYAASKAAMTTAMRGFALALAPQGVRVNVLGVGIVGKVGMAAREAATVPGFAEWASRVVALGRLATPNDVASAAHWLISDEAAHITGIWLAVDGGASLRPDFGGLHG